MFELIIPGPTFYSEGDELNFFEWLYEIKGNPRGIGSHLHVEFKKRPDEEQERELNALFKRYGIKEYEWIQPED